MWQIIKTEYVYAFTAELKNWQWLMPLLFMVGATLFGGLTRSYSEFWIIGILFVGIAFTLHDDNRIYAFSKLPIPLKDIAIARLLMLGINVFEAFLLSLFLISLELVQPFKSNLAFVNLFGGAVVVRLIVYCLGDITIGFNSLKKKLFLIVTFIVLFSIPFFLPFLFNALKTNKYEIHTILTILIPIAIPILSYISIKTFTAKEIITVREE